MALRSQTVLSNYRSISRPSPKSSSGGLSSYATTLARRQTSAEDAIIDNQYESGIISAESYQMELSKRGARDYITPLQKVNIQEKIGAVREKVVDAQVDRQYANGELTTEQVRRYEEEKLSRMSAADSVAYQKQQQKVQGLVDKGEKEKRSQTLIAENLRISRMPEDRSEALWEKAGAYQRLAVQARQDGDAQAADRYETTYNSYVNSAKKADVNDQITGVRLSVSGTPNRVTGVPSASGGTAVVSGRSGSPTTFSANNPVGQKPVATVGGKLSTGVAGNTSTGFNFAGAGGSSSAVNSTLKGIDSKQKQLDTLYNRKADNDYAIQQYQQILQSAEGDQKTQVQIALNNLVEAGRSVDDGIANTTSSIQESIARIGEQRQAAAASAFRKWKSTEESALNQQETILEQKLRAGKITKDQYVREALDLTDAKVKFFGDVENGYRQIGDDDAADKIVYEKLPPITTTAIGKARDQLRAQIEREKDPKKIAKILQQSIGNFSGQFEAIRVDKNGTIDDISGKARNKGDITLKDVSIEKADGSFKQNYIQDGNSYTKLYLGDERDPVTDMPISYRKKMEMLQKGQGSAPFYIDANGKRQNATIINMKNPDGSSRQIVTTADTIKKNPALYQVRKGKDGKATSFYDYKNVEKPKDNTSLLDRTVLKTTGLDLARIPKVLQGKEPIIAKGNPIKPATDFIGKAIQGVGDFYQKNTVPAQDRFGNPQRIWQPFNQNNPEKGKPNTKGMSFLDQAMNNSGVKKVVNSVKNFSLVPKAYASEAYPSQPKATKEATAIIKEALKEQGIDDPKVLAYALATIDHETAGSFKPVNEGYYADKNGRTPGTTGREEAIKRGYSGGSEYFGRGYIQLTHDYNYQKYGDALGIDLVGNPELANDPKIAAKILAMYFKERGTADMVRKGDIVGARGTINGDQMQKGKMIGDTYNKYLKNIGEYDPAPKGILPMTAKEYIQDQRKKGSKRPDKELLSLYKRAEDDMKQRMSAPKNVIAQAKQNVRIEPKKVIAPVVQKPVVTSARDTNKNGTVDWNESMLGSAVNNYVAPAVGNAARSVASGVSSGARNIAQNIFNPPARAQAQQPKIISPLPSSYKAPVYKAPAVVAPKPVAKPAPAPTFIQQAQKFVAPVVQNVQKAAQNVGNFVGSLFKKKK